MGHEARFQAIPEDCELLAHARTDLEVAELMEFFNSYAVDRHRPGWHPQTTAEIYFVSAVKELIQNDPGLVQRYLYAGGRNYDKIVYLLSAERRARHHNSDDSLVHTSIYGSERLHPEATATQGRPIGLVTAQDVSRIADFFDIVTFEQLHQYYDPPRMVQAGVYKMSLDENDELFKCVWSEFGDMRNLYREASRHNEAVVVVLD